jgi:AGZA family xanthine/uracil permease-like MFS transporter
LLGLIGLVITGVLLVKKVQGGFLIGIIATTLIGIPLGVTQFEGIVDTPPSIEPIFMKFDFSQIFTKEMAVVVFTFLFIDMFDTIGTLVGVSRKAGLIKDGKMGKMKKAFMADALGTTAGAILGSCTITTFVESSSGVGVGGRTGLTAFTASICFLLSLFLAPFFLAVPGAATAPVLILVGLMMLSAIKDMNFDDYAEAIPAFICILFMPATYSISEGIVLSVISYVLINLICGKRKNVSMATILLAVVFMLKYIM